MLPFAEGDARIAARRCAALLESHAIFVPTRRCRHSCGFVGGTPVIVKKTDSSSRKSRKSL